jgi:chorismate mutase
MDSSEELKNIRSKIDILDNEICFLLKQRIQLALMTKKHKDSIVDKERELVVLKRAENFGQEIRIIYETIINECRKKQL